jgi:hypothetical protein
MQSDYLVIHPKIPAFHAPKPISIFFFDKIIVFEIFTNKCYLIIGGNKMKFRNYLSSFLVASMLLTSITPGFAMSGSGFLNRMPDNSLLIGTTAFNIDDREQFNLDNTLSAVKTIGIDEENHMYFKIVDSWYDLVDNGKKVEDISSISNNVIDFKGISLPTEDLIIISEDNPLDNDSTIIHIEKDIEEGNYRKYKVSQVEDIILPTTEDKIEGELWLDIPSDGIIKLSASQIVIVSEASAETKLAKYAGFTNPVIKNNIDGIIREINEADEDELLDIMKRNTKDLELNFDKFDKLMLGDIVISSLSKGEYVDKKDFVETFNEMIENKLIIEKNDRIISNVADKIKKSYKVTCESGTKKEIMEELKKIVKTSIDCSQVEIGVEPSRYEIGKFTVLVEKDSMVTLVSNITVFVEIVGKNDLKNAVKLANEVFEEIIVSTDGFNVPIGKKWVREDEKLIFENAIKEAEKILGNGSSTKEEIKKVLESLDKANKLVKDGEKKILSLENVKFYGTPKIGGKVGINAETSDGKPIGDRDKYSVIIFESSEDMYPIGSLYNTVNDLNTFIIPKEFVDDEGNKISIEGKRILYTYSIKDGHGLGYSFGPIMKEDQSEVLALEESINKAKDLISKVIVATDASRAEKGKLWVEESEEESLKNVILENEESVLNNLNTTIKEYKLATKNLNNEIIKFENAMKQGKKDITE